MLIRDLDQMVELVARPDENMQRISRRVMLDRLDVRADATLMLTIYHVHERVQASVVIVTSRQVGHHDRLGVTTRRLG